ncbi:MAG: YkgJ family cysteine cluster protein [Gammaproteobacteria bacterium]|nr:YkgJ family cysteine cluster protein [Gammaproteobacteria bacterium]
MSDDPKLLRAVDITEEQDLPAGGFSVWLRRTRTDLTAQVGADVPCGECNACCHSSYFIHIGPEETQTLELIPEELLFAAPGQSEGVVLLGYGEDGKCPMLVDEKCSIYEHRPQTCRNYDCRIFPAAGIAAAEDDKVLITQRTRRWKFSYPSADDRTEHAAVQAAARFLRERAEYFADEIPTNAIQLAILAIKVSGVFLQIHEAHEKSAASPSDPDVARSVEKALSEMAAPVVSAK